MTGVARVLRGVLARAGVDVDAVEIRRLAVRFMSVGAMRCAAVPLSVLANVLMARTLGPGGLGIFAATMALARMLAVAASAGVPVALMRLLPSYIVRKEFDRAAGCVAWAYLHGFATSLIAGAALAIVVVELRWLEHVEANLVGIAILGALVLLAIQRGILQGFENVLTAQLPEFFISPLVFVALLIVYALAVAGGGGGSATSVLAFQLAAFAVAVAFGAVRIAAGARKILRKPRRAFLVKTWYAISTPMIAAQIGNVVCAQSGFLILKQFGYTQEVGLYNVATVLSLLVAFPLLIVNAPLPPALARLFAADKLGEVRKLVTASARVAMFASLPLVAIAAAGGPWLLDLAYGPRFAEAYPLLLVLTAGQFSGVAAGSVGLIMNMTGHERDVAVTGTSVAIAQVAVSIAVVPHFGAMGAAVAQAVATAAWNAVLVWCLLRRNGIDPTCLGLHRK